MMLRHTLSLAAVLLSFPLALAVNGDFGVKDYARFAWRWSDEKASLDYCVKKFNAKVRDGTVRVEAYQFEANLKAVFVLEGDRLFIILSPEGCGPRVTAVDLKTGTKVWVAALKDTGPVVRRMNIETDGKAVIVWVNEARGRYVRILDAKTGQKLGHKEFGAIAPGK
jgi:hypothetical protein